MNFPLILIICCQFIADENCAIQSKASRLKSETLRLESIFSSLFTKVKNEHSGDKSTVSNFYKENTNLTVLTKKLDTCLTFGVNAFQVII